MQRATEAINADIQKLNKQRTKLTAENDGLKQRITDKNTEMVSGRDMGHGTWVDVWMEL